VFFFLFGSLIFDSGIKSNLLDYAHTTLLFSDCNVDANVVAWNRYWSIGTININYGE